MGSFRALEARPGPGIGEPFRMVVEEGKILEFARAVRADLPEHRGPNAIAPATFLAACAHWMSEENSGWKGQRRDFRRVLHGEQEFVLPSGPPRAGTELVGQQRIERIYHKRGKRGGMMKFTDVVTEFSDGDGHLVATMRSTSIETETDVDLSDSEGGT